MAVWALLRGLHSAARPPLLCCSQLIATPTTHTHVAAGMSVIGICRISFPRCAPSRYSKARSEKESELQRKGRRWLLCAAAAIAAYIVASGQVGVGY